jgi:transposase
MTTAAEYIGIDVAKATLAVGSSTRLLGEFPNTPAGFKAISKLLSSLTVACVVFEATGIYGHHAIEALMLDGYAVAVVQPNSVRHFALSLKIYAKTDALDATVIARFGAATKPRLMQKKPKEYVLLRAYSDRRDQVIAMRVSEQNHLEACLDAAIQKDLKAAIKRLEKEEARYTKMIATEIGAHPEIEAKRKILENESGVGAQTAAILIAHLPELGAVNRQKIAALVGFAPFNRDSGNMRGTRSIYGGRKRVRKAMYMATLSAVRWNATLHEFYVKLLAKGKCKMVALIACARKLLIRLNSLLAAAAKTTQETAQMAGK